MHGDDSPQMMLFAELPTPPDAAPQGPRRPRVCVPWRVAVAALLPLLQRPLTWRLRELETDMDTAFDIPRRAVIPAAALPPPETKAPRSIFDMAAQFRGGPRVRFREQAPAKLSSTYRVERDADRVRVVRVRPEETEERIEQERARRARQRPPRPTAKAKTRGKKVRAWDGEGNDD